jgi:hypothetical protein
MSEPELHISLNLEESGIVLQALAECPFKTVFELIGKLNHQAQQFYQPPIKTGEPVSFHFSPAEFSCCIKALGQLPYNQVHLLLANLHTQLRAQKMQNPDIGE